MILRRRRAYLFGHGAETRAAIWLRLKGYRVLARRFRTRLGEIDIIASRFGVLCFVEVKARCNISDAHRALSKHQQRRITNAARIWLQRHEETSYGTMRFDVILIAPRHLPRHIENAFMVE